jgi:hypothetical protein
LSVGDLLLVAIASTEGFGGEEALGAGVDVFDDGIFLVGVEIARTDDDAKDVGDTVAAFGDEAFGKAVAGEGKEFGGVGLLELADELAGVGAAKLGDLAVSLPDQARGPPPSQRMT